MLVAYLSFDGTTEQAFEFYKAAFGGEFVNVQRFGDTPQGAQMPDGDKKKIMHIALKTADGSLLMGNDHLDFMGEKFVLGNNISMSFHPKTKEQADNAFNSLANGGQVIMPMAVAPWGDYFGMLVDKYGIKWMVNQTKE